MVSETLNHLKINVSDPSPFSPQLLFIVLHIFTYFYIFLHISPKIGLTYLPVCAACFVAFPSLKARPLIDNMFPIHISFKGGSAHVKALAVPSGIFTLSA
jgi:hypothetical protein